MKQFPLNLNRLLRRPFLTPRHDFVFFSSRLTLKYISPVAVFLIWLIACGFLFSADSGNSKSPIYDPLGQQQPPWVKAARAGNKLWEKGDEAGAMREWEEAISQGFSDGIAFYYLGRYYARLGEWDKSINYLRKAKPLIIGERKDPEVLVDIYEILATAYMKNRRYYESYIHYQKALNLDPESSSIHLGLANLYLLRGKLNEADKEARQVLVKSPSMARAYWIIASAAEKRGEYPAAVEYYRKFLALEPDQWEARLALGLLLHYQMKQTDRAERELKKVTDQAPEDGRAYAVLGKIYLGRRDPESALIAVEKSLKYDPETYHALIIRGQLYLNEGDELRAEKLFYEALRINPDGVLAIYWTGMILFQKGDYPEAERHFKKASRLEPRFHDAALNHGLVLEVLGRRSEALRILKEVVKDNPAFALGQLGLGRLFYYSGKRKKALPCFRNALALDRSLWEPLYFIGRCLHDRGDIVESLEYYLLARKLENENPQLLTDLAIAYAETNRSSQAEELLNEALSVDPNYLRAMIQLGLLKARKDDFRGADSIYRQALILRPGDVSWGNQEEQKDFLIRMVTDVEDYLGAGIDYMSLYGVMKNMSGGREVFSELIPILKEKIRRQPLKPEYPHLLGMAYQEKGESANAEKYYLRAVRNDSDFAAAHLSLGQLYAGRKKYDLAREHLQGVLTLNPDSALSPVVREILKSLPE